MLFVLTIAIGLVTMTSQSELLFGVLLALTVAWGLLAVDALVIARDSRRRQFWMTFLLTTSAALPARLRALVRRFGAGDRFPADAKTWATYWSEVLPSTKAFMMLSHLSTASAVQD